MLVRLHPSLKQKRGVIKMGVGYAGKVVPSTAVHSVQGLLLLQPRRVKGLGHGCFPALPLREAVPQSLPTTGVSTNEQEILSLTTLWGVCTEPSPSQCSGQSACHSQICSLSGKLLQQGFPEPPGQDFPLVFPMLFFPWPCTCIAIAMAGFSSETTATGVRITTSFPPFIYSLFCGFKFTLREKNKTWYKIVI